MVIVKRGGVAHFRRYVQRLYLKDAYDAYKKYKQSVDPSFTCSISWFSKQRPPDVKKLVPKPTGGARSND